MPRSSRRADSSGADAAICGPNGVLTLNVDGACRAWWTDEQAVDRVLIFALAHLNGGDTRSDGLREECCRLGALLRRCRTRLAQQLRAA